MTLEALSPEACPRCHSIARVRPKILLVNAAGSSTSASQSEWRASCACDAFSVDDLKSEFAIGSQFIQGLYCESCSIGYLPESVAKPAAPRYQATPEGWRRVLPDGTVGPVFQRISDDPESQVR
jgi:hypothetical protein